MNLIKSSLLSLLLSFAIINPATSFADAPAKGAQGWTVANVNIEGARILSEKGNNFNIAFSISNREGLQSGAKYGVQLMPESNKYIVDQKVYDESVTLYENSTIKREIAYSAPTTLSGTYNMYLVSSNSSGLTFGIASLGKVKLAASTKGVTISVDSCYLTVVDETSGTHYTINQGVDINTSESLKLTCTATNATNESVSLAPSFETRYYNQFGEVAPQTGGDNALVTIPKNSSKVFSVVMPKASNAGFYNVKFSLMNAATSSSSILVRYIISGINASILKASFDKDYYNFGDSGVLSVLWSASSGNFPRTNIKKATPPRVTLNAKVTNKSGSECVESIDQVLERSKNSPGSDIPIKFKSSCVDPHVYLTISDEGGNVLDQKDYAFTTSSAHAPKPMGESTVIVIVIILVILAVVGVVLKKKKAANNQ